MTSKPDYVSTLGYHWTDHTGRPLEPQVHWDATGTTVADASNQWCPSGDPVLACIIETHWNTTEMPQKDHWKYTGNALATNNSFSSGIPVYIGVWIPGTLDYHWMTTELPLAQGKGWYRKYSRLHDGKWNTDGVYIRCKMNNIYVNTYKHYIYTRMDFKINEMFVIFGDHYTFC